MNHRLFTLPFLAIAVCLVSTGVGTADDVDVTFEGHFGGSTDAVVVSGNYAYVNQGQDFVVLDISNPEAPSELGRLFTDDFIRDINVSGSYAYVADSSTGLLIIDINNPAAPTLAGSYDTPGYAYGVEVLGSYAYVADYLNGLVIINISNPAAPTLAGSYDTAGQAYGVAVSGSYAYVADGYNGLVIIDISNPAASTPVGSYDTAGQAYGVAVSGSHAYVADNYNGLVIIDISNPAASTPVGSYDTAIYSRSVEVSGSYAYVAYSNGLFIIDISNSAAPTTVGSYDTAGQAYGVEVSGSYAYVADGYNGLFIINISNPAAPTLAGSYDTVGSSLDVAVSGSYAYVADLHNGLVIIDISNPAAPTPAGSYNTAGDAYVVAVSGSYAYVADNYNGLFIIDISNPAAPTLAGSYDMVDGRRGGIVVSGSYAYVTAILNGLFIIDISNPAAPNLVGSYDMVDGWMGGIAVSGSYAYVANLHNGLLIIDISNPAAPIPVGSYDTPGETYGVAVSGSYAYIADGNNGLLIIDISNPATPTPVGSYDTAGEAYGVEVSGSYAYVADGYNGLFIIDISNPAAPTPVGSYKAVEAYGVEVSGSYAYVADRYGLVILRIDVTLPPSILVGQGAPTPEIEQLFIDAYDRNGGVGVLGDPATEVHDAWGYWVQDFPGENGYAGGIIMYNSNENSAYYIHGKIWDRYYSLGGPIAKTDIEFQLGLPINDVLPYVHSEPPLISSHGSQYRYQNFAGETEMAALEYNLATDMVYEIHGAIYATWSAMGYADSILGLVTSDEREAVASFKGTTGRVSDFENGHLHWHSSGDHAGTTYMTYGDLDKLYVSMGGTDSWLGFPVMHQEERSGYGYCEFEGGYIEWDGSEYKAKAAIEIIKPGIVFEGTFDQFNYGTYPMIMEITSVDGLEFNGILHWPTLGDSKTKFRGNIDSVTNKIWFTEYEQIQGSSNIVLNGDYYADLEGQTLSGYWNWPNGGKGGTFSIIMSGTRIFESQIIYPVNNANIAEDYVTDKSLGPKTTVEFKGKVICDDCQPPYDFYWTIDDIESPPQRSQIGESTYPYDFFNSGSHVVELRVKDNNEKESTTSQVNFEINVNIAYIPVYFIDGSTTHKTITELEERANKVEDYYEKQSYGKEKLQSRFIFDDWYEMPESLEYYGNYYQEVCKNSKDSSFFGSCVVFHMFNDNEYLKSTYLQKAKDNNLYGGYDESGFSVLFIITPESSSVIRPSRAGGLPWAVANDRIQGEEDNKFYTGYGTWAHELGHAQFGFNDYDDEIGDWGLMGTGIGEEIAYLPDTDPIHIISYNKEIANWLEYENMYKGDKKQIKLLEEMQPPNDKIWIYDTQKNKIVSNYIFERRKPLKLPDILKQGVLIYQVESEKPKVIENKGLSFYPTLINPWDSYSDPSEEVKFSLNLWGEIEIENYIPKNTKTLKLWVISNFPANEYFGVPNINSTPFDINLYAISNEKIVGLNVTSNMYEMQIDGAEASGNVYGAGSEWITLPNNVNAYYMIDASLAKKWMEENQEFSSNIKVGMQLIQYDEDGQRTDFEPIEIDVSIDNPIAIVTLSSLLPYNITFLPPITTMDQYNLKDGSTLPIKFTARNRTTDEFIYDNTVNVTITDSTGHLITYFTHGTGTDSVRINSEEEQYIANFHTKDYAINIGETYSVTVTFGEPDSLRGYDITYFTLIEGGKAKGKGN